MRRRVLGVFSAVAMAVVAMPGPSVVHADPPTLVSQFRGLTPARLLDTRASGSTVDDLFEAGGARGAVSTLDLVVAGRGGVPANAGAVALNVTAIGPTARSFITVFPTGETRPNASNLNLDTGRTLPNMVIASVGTGGKVSIYNDAGSTHLAVDVLGWFPDDPDVYNGVAPARLLDTRASGSTVDDLFEAGGVRGAVSTLVLDVADRGGVPTDAGAVALNVTAINPTGGGFITVFPTGLSKPNASNLNLAPGRTLPNMVIVPLGDGGKVSLYNDSGTTHLAVDVLGWFPALPSSLGSVAPARLLDTRASGSTVDDLFEAGGVRGAATTLSLEVGGRGNVPLDAAAVVLNVTAIGPSGGGFITVFPTGQTRPNASNLNLAPGRTLPNMVIVPLGTDGEVSLYNDAGSTHLAVDVLGWFPDLSTPPTTTRASVSSSEVQATGESRFPSMSSDGNFVVFESAASDLVAGDTNGSRDVFVRDLTLGTTELVSKSTAGVIGNFNSGVPSISGDGRYVTFESGATNLVADDTNDFYDVFVHDRNTGVTSRVSVSSAAAQGNGASYASSISDDGRYVAFQSLATNLVAGDANGVLDVYVRDRTNATTTRVSTSTSGPDPNGDSTAPHISADGSTIVFQSVATTLVVFADANNAIDVFAYDMASGTITRINESAGANQLNNASYLPRVSGNGRYVSFTSAATNLVGGDTNGQPDVFVFDRQTSSTNRVSINSAGVQQDGSAYYSDISDDGRYVAFESYATNLGGGTGSASLFLHDRQTGSTIHVVTADDGTDGNGFTTYPGLSADGQLLVHMSDATNLVTGDTNGVRDVFVYDQGVG